MARRKYDPEFTPFVPAETLPLAIGVTATRKGITLYQSRQAQRWLEMLRPYSYRFHHGNCRGGDIDLATIAARLDYFLIAHPSNLKTYNDKTFGLNNRVLDAQPPLDRNQVIVQRVDLLLVCPKTMGEEMRSGTWFTVRRAREAQLPYVVLWPEEE